MKKFFISNASFSLDKKSFFLVTWKIFFGILSRSLRSIHVYHHLFYMEKKLFRKFFNKRCVTRVLIWTSKSLLLVSIVTCFRNKSSLKPVVLILLNHFVLHNGFPIKMQGRHLACHFQIIFWVCHRLQILILFQFFLEPLIK